MSNEEKVRALLNEYMVNASRLRRMEANATFSEWEEDYRARRATGGVRASLLERTIRGNHKGSIQEHLLMEQEEVCEKIRNLRAKADLTKFLLFQLNEDERRLIEMKFFEKISVRTICEILYVSRSSLYRRIDAVIKKLAMIYSDFFHDCGPDLEKTLHFQ
uniref:hypothetical protein n=1 Tax=Ndongobacter massiliensis TaxID=1871025 RepID=UPI00092FDCA2|nr:hypothetical protein [Ndongobacter massiliensis]